MAEQDTHSLASLRFSPGPMPVLFVGHGSPMNAIEDNAFSRNWRELGRRLPAPEAILCVSAHWLTRGTAVTAMAQPRMIHDFWGFPEALNAYRYPAPGDPALARSIAGLVTETEVTLDEEWGLDHGTWIVLTNMFPDAEIPVLQLSIDPRQPAQYHYALGQEVQALRERGVLLVGSGNIVHNLGRMDLSAGRGYDWAIAFDAAIAKRLVQRDYQGIIDYEALGRMAQQSVPTNDHYLPLLYVAGASSRQDRIAFFSEQIVYGSVSMRCALLY
jgi:4,5-DOPA dioxygenase extradiol